MKGLASFHGRVVEGYSKTDESVSSSSESEGALSKPGSRLQELAQSVRSQSKRHLVALQSWNVFSSSMRRTGKIGNGFVTIPSLLSSTMSFTLLELEAATNSFSQASMIGKGGYAEVYKGKLKNGKRVAIKRMIKGSKNAIISDILSELGIIARVNHPNATKLIGYCFEGGMHLVLELCQRGSLASLLYGAKEPLSWEVRYKIALGVCEGLVYLHEGRNRRIIHRDIKASNILLTADYTPKIGDFGLAKWLPENWTHHVMSKFEGTFGYLAPEYLMNGVVDEKTDVFAYGVLLLELVTGRKAVDCSHQSLVLWAKPMLKKNETREMVDPGLMGGFNCTELNLVLLAASLCILQTSMARPTMKQVREILKGQRRFFNITKRYKTGFLRKAFNF